MLRATLWYRLAYLSVLQHLFLLPWFIRCVESWYDGIRRQSIQWFVVGYFDFAIALNFRLPYYFLCLFIWKSISVILRWCAGPGTPIAAIFFLLHDAVCKFQIAGEYLVGWGLYWLPSFCTISSVELLSWFLCVYYVLPLLLFVRKLYPITLPGCEIFFLPLVLGV